MVGKNYDRSVVEEWQRRRKEHSRKSLPIFALLLVAAICEAITVFVFGLAILLPAIGLWLILLLSFFAVGAIKVEGELTCPNCGEMPFHLGGGMIASSNPARCYHCHKLLKHPK